MSDPLVQQSAQSHSVEFLATQPLQICDNSNRCIVDATMALKPLMCLKYPSDAW
jgi:hypothetical protein